VQGSGSRCKEENLKQEKMNVFKSWRQVSRLSHTKVDHILSMQCSTQLFLHRFENGSRTKLVLYTHGLTRSSLLVCLQRVCDLHTTMLFVFDILLFNSDPANTISRIMLYFSFVTETINTIPGKENKFFCSTSLTLSCKYLGMKLCNPYNVLYSLFYQSVFLRIVYLFYSESQRYSRARGPRETERGT
jgi:hypothetical protein